MRWEGRKEGPRAPDTGQGRQARKGLRGPRGLEGKGKGGEVCQRLPSAGTLIRPQREQDVMSDVQTERDKGGWERAKQQEKESAPGSHAPPCESEASESRSRFM